MRKIGFRESELSLFLYGFVFLATFSLTIIMSQRESFGDITVPVVVAESYARIVPPDMPPPAAPASRTASAGGDEYAVQAVLSPKHRTVIAAGIDARITAINFENGDKFSEGDVLISYDCDFDLARLKEAQARTRLTTKQLEAFEKLYTLDSVADIELENAREQNAQNMAIVEQIRARLKACRHIAPYDGRVTNKLASDYEYVQTGRVLLEIVSSAQLRAEFLIPSRWLRWLNIGSPLSIYINETGHEYEAEIVAIHGEVDPVSQSIQVVAEIEEYHEELLPGMSGQARFAPGSADGGERQGFLDLKISPTAEEKHEPAAD